MGGDLQISERDDLLRAAILYFDLRTRRGREIDGRLGCNDDESNARMAGPRGRGLNGPDLVRRVAVRKL